LALLRIEKLKINYLTRKGLTQAVDGVTFQVNEGENLGLVGESGCGKSTIAKAILRILPENSRIAGGHVYLQDRDILGLDSGQLQGVRWKQISMISQSAMNALNPVYRLEKQMVEILAKREGLGKKEALHKAVELFELVGLDPHRLADFPHQLSGGMKQRAVIAMALALNPNLIIADEPTTALDVITQDQVLQNIYNLQAKLKKSMILITHDISIVAEGCHKIAVMYAGKLMEVGDIKAVFQCPCNPYTMGLHNAFPSVKGEKKDLISIPGYPPSLIGLLQGCRFYSRCPFSLSRCAVEEPPMIGIEGSHLAACHRVDRAEEFRVLARRKETWDKMRDKIKSA
jgi:oligopeptide/dipeptide ABC transporter ATP-binding protein